MNKVLIEKCNKEAERIAKLWETDREAAKQSINQLSLDELVGINIGLTVTA